MKPVLIIESSNESMKLKENKEGKKDYSLFGPMTYFDTLNRNSRIYTADEFLPHLNEMMKKKEWGVIYGEFDHPDNFDIALKYVSHTVENAFYNKEQNRVDGEIRLLNTHYGKDAKALVDDGLPIFISSRAAGITESNGNVKLKQLFTYDIVADPGFAEARMQVKTMNESLNFKNENLMLIESTKHQLAQLSSKYEKSSDPRIFDLSDDSKTNKLFNMNNNDMVTKKQLSDWSKYLISQIKENEAKIYSTITESKDKAKAEDISKLLEYQENLKEQFSKMEKYLDYLADKIQVNINTTEVLEKKTEKIVEYSNYLSEYVDKSIDYANYLAEGLDNSIGYTNYLGENLDKSINYTNYIAENLDQAIDYTEYIAEKLTTTIEHTEIIAEKLDKTIDYTQYIAENLDTNIGYANYIGENLDVNIGYVQYVAENLDSTINYADYLSECVDKTMEYSNSISEKLNKTEGNLITEKFETAEEYITREKNTKIQENKISENIQTPTKTIKTIGDLKAKNKMVKEEVKTPEIKQEVKTTEVKQEVKINETEEHKNFKEFINDNTSKETLSNKIDKLIDEAKKREASKDVKPNFYEFLTIDDIRTFENLTQENQEEIKVAINESTGYYSKQDVLAIMRQVLEKDKQSPEELLVQNIPADIKPIWEKMDTKIKKSILSQAKFYNVSSKELVEHFWNTRNFDTIKNDNKVLLESNNPFEKMNKLSDNEIDFFTEKFKGLN